MRGLPLVVLCALGCKTTVDTTVSMGNYGVTVTPMSSSCNFPDGSVPATSFELRFALERPSDGGNLELILNGCGASAADCPRNATWDGQVLTSVATSPRQFDWCSCPMEVVESMRLAIYSNSQSEAVGGQCPADPFAVPPPSTTISLPGPEEDGYDSLLVCGTLGAEYRPYDAGDAGGGDAGLCAKECTGCVRNFGVRGRRR